MVRPGLSSSLLASSHPNSCVDNGIGISAADITKLKANGFYTVAVWNSFWIYTLAPRANTFSRSMALRGRLC